MMTPKQEATKNTLIAVLAAVGVVCVLIAVAKLIGIFGVTVVLYTFTFLIIVGIVWAAFYEDARIKSRLKR